MLSTAQINGHNDLVLTEDGVTSLRGVSPLHSHTLISQSALDPALVGNDLFDKVSPFYYNERVRLTFSVSDKFKSDFSLIRGLIEFNRPRNLAFHYDLEHRSVRADINSSQFDVLQRFLSLVLDILIKEREFRHALKIAIEFENRYRLERDSVYAIIRDTTAAMSTVR